ncbi:MAG TPA: ABC transporter substrate-binding protein [Thermomicrobiales bacterium]|nr:ABC transporter substrate-binding protein [Thermomicrobiales bacterium]
MIKDFSRRSIIKGAASAAVGASVLGAPSKTFAAPARLQSTGSNAEITLWTAFGSGVNGEAQAKLVEDFNAQGNGVTVTAQVYESYEAVAQALITGLQTGDVPDVATLSDVWWFRFYLSQALADLTEMAQEPDDYVETLYADYQRNGGQFGVPFARSTPLLYFNRDVLEAAGLDESIFETWSSTVEAAPDLLAAGDNMTAAFGFGNAASYGAWFLHGPVWAFDGRYSDEEFNILIDQEGAVNCGEFMREFVQSGNAAAVTDPSTDFQTGGIAATIQSTGALGGITEAAQFDVGTHFLPEEIEFGCPTGGTGLSVMAGASDENKQAAMDFISFSTNTENATYWAMTTGYMPVRNSAIESEEFQTFITENPNNRVAIEQLPLTRPQDTARVFIPNGDQILGQGWEQVLVNNVPAAEAFAEVAQILNEEKEPVLEALQELEG